MPSPVPEFNWNAPELRALIRHALEEDHAGDDRTTDAIFPAVPCPAQGWLLARQEACVCGLPLVARVLEEWMAMRNVNGPAAAISIHLRAREGDWAHADQCVLEIAADIRALLACERTLLNFVQHLSGIATLTHRYLEQLKGTRARLLDTRKTLPGLRTLEKYAVACGGGHNHRPHLAGGILIKNNHLALLAGMETEPEPNAVALALARAGTQVGLGVEIEVRSEQELEQALAAGADWILLDNFSPAQVGAAVRRVEGRARLEVSGGIRLETIHEYAQTGVDAISAGALTHSAPAADFSLRISAEPDHQGRTLERRSKKSGAST